MKRVLFSALILLMTSFNLIASSTVWDYDGDGKTDLLIRRVIGDSTSGYTIYWYILKSQQGFFASAFGNSVPQVSGDGPIPGDFDGDGKWDLAVVRDNAGNSYNQYFILNSSNNTLAFYQWGLRYDTLMPQDYDGDGKTDLGVYRDGWWYLQQSRDGFHAEKFGGITGNYREEPIAGDYDGDGRADLALIRWFVQTQTAIPVTFLIRRSSDGSWQQFTFGDKRGDLAVPGDYDGDGRTDIALWGGANLEYGDGRWRYIRSSDGAFVSVRFGYPGDYAVPGDYDGDGRTDFAVYRRGTTIAPQNYFYIWQSGSQDFKAVAWGSAEYADFTPMNWFSR